MMKKSVFSLKLMRYLTMLSLFIVGIAVLSGSVVAADTSVTVTSAATVGVVSLEDTSGETFATSMIDPTKAGMPLVITYDPEEHELATISILGAGFFPVTVNATNPPEGTNLSVAFTLSADDQDAGFGTVTVVHPASASTKTPAPFIGLLAGLGIASLVFARMRK